MAAGIGLEPGDLTPDPESAQVSLDRAFGRAGDRGDGLGAVHWRGEKRGLGHSLLDEWMINAWMIRVRFVILQSSNH